MRICFIGDSFTNGTGDGACLGWPGRLGASARDRGHDVTVYNLGVRGNTSADIAARWRAEASGRLPEEWMGRAVDGRLLFSFGSNDCNITGGAPRLAPDDALANARSILTAAQMWRPTMMVGPPPMTDDEVNRGILALTGGLGALCAELEIPFLATAGTLLAVPEWRAEALDGDGIHPDRGGYSRLADLVEGWDAWRAWCP